MSDYKSGIDVTFGGTEGVDWAEEYLYHDKLVDDHKVVYIKDSTTIAMSHNARNCAMFNSTDLGFGYIIGVSGLSAPEGAGGPGTIRYRIDRDRQYWSQRGWAAGYYTYPYPAYSSPFTLASLTYDDTPQGGSSTTPVVGTTGAFGIGGATQSDKANYYYRGILDPFGDEWHVLSYADDDADVLTAREAVSGKASYEAASDGKTVLLVVNPKTPCCTVTVSGTGQFFTSTPKAYWTPKVVQQTTYIDPGSSGSVTITLHDINGNNVFWRIGGGSFTDAGSSTKVLTDSDFSSGSNTLEYYYAGNAAYTKTRIVVKSPAYPSAGEAHGYALFVDSTNYSAILDRITRAPYYTTYNYASTRSDFSGHDTWDATAGIGRRVFGVNGSSYLLANAVVAKIEGFGYTLGTESKSYGQYAKEMLLENPRCIDPLGFESSHSSDVIPSRELHYRGYYDASPLVNMAFAYDIFAANFRADQVAGGMTPIEDYFIREKMAGFAFEAMQWSAGMQELGSPGMWGGARMTAAVLIAMVMPEYTSLVYGTSGFGTVQTTYAICPFADDEYTWKEVLYDGNKTKTAFPNLTYYTGWDNADDIDSSLFLPAGFLVGGYAMEEGDWIDKTAYLSPGQMETYFTLWMNMAKIKDNRSFPRLDAASVKLTTSNMRGAKVDSSASPPENLVSTQTPVRRPVLSLMNARFPTAWANNLAWLQSLDPSNNDSPAKNMGFLEMAWYDDSGYFPVATNRHTRARRAIASGCF